MSFDFPLILDGAGRVATGERESRLGRAVISSLFTWARAREGDELPTPESPRMGFWGDTYSPVTGDRWGSRLWLLARETLTASTVAKARDLAKEALEWMVVDKVAERIQVEATRNGVDRLDMRILVDEPSGARLDIRFADIWGAIRG
ncbi:phage GP46 family protein [Pseudomonas anguilliseptica]|uniref:Mu-like prophage protein gp46 n=1 Tax=Pseudomonas anguilliseptica TaxID=53406 RepID=A0A1H4V1S5_PSEAG|nr:phage GP46 family protein [Pseudomonas anguilliseptica]SEC74471.1 Mu-like prophage protein gp46 [Pseudomonas anguilliseptica]